MGTPVVVSSLLNFQKGKTLPSNCTHFIANGSVHGRRHSNGMAMFDLCMLLIGYWCSSSHLFSFSVSFSTCNSAMQNASLPNFQKGKTMPSNCTHFIANGSVHGRRHSNGMAMFDLCMLLIGYWCSSSHLFSFIVSRSTCNSAMQNES